MLQMFYQWNADTHNWLGVGVIVVLALGVYHYFRLNDSRHVERTVARALERRRVADILSNALQDAAVRGEITSAVREKYHMKVAREFNLPDMLPTPKFNLTKALVLSRQRLNKMGVDIGAGLARIRGRSKPKSKLDILDKAIKRK